MQARDLVVGYAACDFRVPVPWIGAIQLGGFNQRMGDGRRCSAYRIADLRPVGASGGFA